jgi:predicted deacetylase
MQYNVNISIDDVSPHPASSAKVLERCQEIIDVFPEAKFSLFIPVAYWRTMGETATEQPLRLDQYPEFCEEIKNLSSNFEIAYHGLFHGIPKESNNDEFQYLNFSQTTQRLNMMKKIVDNAGLEFKPYFRPPAWRMSGEAITASREWGIEILALSPEQYAKETYGGEEAQLDDVVYYNVNPPFKPLSLYEKTEVVYHACEWDKNYLDREKTDQLIDFLSQRREQINFCFLEELV